jgi:hypothetical protein
MNRHFYGTVGLTTLLVSLFSAGALRAEEPLSGPSLETKGKPLNEAAPSTGITPKLVGLSAFGGVMLVDMGPVNDRLAEQRALYPSNLPVLFPILGGQGFGLFNHFLIGGSGAGLLSRSVDEVNDRKVSASGAWGTFDFGYQLLRVNGFMIAPVLSLGGYGMSVTAAAKGDIAFNDALQSANRSVTLTNNGFLTGISVVAKSIVIGRNARVAGAKSGYSLGLRIGGLYGIPTRGFRADGAHVNGAPSFGLRGGYAALSLGVGTW